MEQTESGQLGTVYLLHFSKKLAHAKHYIGWTGIPLEDRIERHKKGGGASLTRACVQQGIGFRVSRTWNEVDRHFERKLKKRKNAKHLCPLCAKRNTRAK